MNEGEWVELIARRLRTEPPFKGSRLQIQTKYRLTYGHEIAAYDPDGTPHSRPVTYETDLAILERGKDETLRPRVVVEAKIDSITTHDAITYSAKAAAHRSVHPYLRYGIMLGHRGEHALPGRLFHHGGEFDFMVAFRSFRPHSSEVSRFVDVLRNEVKASRLLEAVLFDSRKRDRSRFTLLHRRLCLK